jgi:hypothetical protein
MPYGQWVAFENNEPHDCDNPPVRVRVEQPIASGISHPNSATEEFEDFELPSASISAKGVASPPSTGSRSATAATKEGLGDVGIATVAESERRPSTTPVENNSVPDSRKKAPKTSSEPLQTQFPAQPPSPVRPTAAAPLAILSQTRRSPPPSSVLRRFIISLGSFIISLIGVIGVGGFYLLAFGMLPGWAFWMWMAIHFGSFGMFLFGFLGPLGFVASALGLWSLLFGAPAWLIHLVT